MEITHFVSKTKEYDDYLKKLDKFIERYTETMSNPIRRKRLEFLANNMSLKTSMMLHDLKQIAKEQKDKESKDDI